MAANRGEVNPQYRPVLQHRGIAEWPSIKIAETHFRSQVHDLVFRVVVISCKESICGTASKSRVSHYFRSEMVETLYDWERENATAIAATTEPSGGGAQTGPFFQFRGLVQSMVIFPARSPASRNAFNAVVAGNAIYDVAKKVFAALKEFTLGAIQTQGEMGKTAQKLGLAIAAGGVV